MTLIFPTTKLADAIHEYYLLIPVINRFGIRLGFGDDSIQTICEKHGVDVDFFTAILNTFAHEHYFSEVKLKSFSITQIVDYLRKTHKYYIDVAIGTIESQIEALSNSSQSTKHAKIIKQFFAEYKNELLAHLEREDKNTFPYIERLLEIQKSENSKELYAQLPKAYSMKVFEQEHGNVDEKLYDLKNILIKYFPADYTQNLGNSIVFELFRLEKDLKDHTRLEDKILTPKVKELEQQLKS